MSDRIERIPVTGEGLTLSRLIWNRFQTPMPTLLGQIYDLNPGLADQGCYLSVGTIVLLPVPDQEEQAAPITLWD